MVPDIRKQYNQEFTPETYKAFSAELQALFPGQLEFRVAETPLFIPKDFTRQMLEACDSIIDAISQPLYQQQSNRAIPEHLRVPNEDEQSHFIAFDFGICKNDRGEIEPQLIEMQGFPTMFAYQVFYPAISNKYFNIPPDYDYYLNGFTEKSYTELLRKIIVAGEDPKQVVLLEVLPHQQKTRIDFYCTEALLGIKTVDLTELIKEGAGLFYRHNGEKIKIKRIYNRLIFDDLFQQSAEVQEKGKLFQQELEVTWVPHPSWFYRISKFSLPFIHHPFVPQTWFLNEVNPLPADLENYVVKPLFSFAGQGVIIDVTKQDIEKIRDPQNWILQRKVNYAAVIQTPDEPAKAEIRLFYFLDPDTNKYIATTNLARLSKGKMVGVRYNKDREWVGGTYALFQK